MKKVIKAILSNRIITLGSIKNVYSSIISLLDCTDFISNKIRCNKY